MNKTRNTILSMLMLFACLAFLTMGASGGCNEPNSDDIQQNQQEQILKEATAQTGMPAIKNFRERKLLKTILEMRDQDGLVTYTYLENLTPTVVHGVTALGGKLTFFGQTIGYGIPYATEYTNPQKAEHPYNSIYYTIPQADPNGLFSPGSAEGTWVLMANPNKPSEVKPVYVEPRILTSPFKLPFD